MLNSNLFQHSVLNQSLSELDLDTLKPAFKKLEEKFQSQSRQENIINSKEEEYQSQFLSDLFVDVLGYTLKPDENFNLIRERKNQTNNQKADGAILKGEEVIAVIELKGTNTKALEKITDQAFGYKNNQANCSYIITSNFEKLRFYIDNAVEHLEFDLFNLTFEEFQVLWLCLEKNNLLNDLPKKIKKQSLINEEEITKKLYKEYHNFRNEIFADIKEKNTDIDSLTLFKKTQKLLDRFLFIFFAEDRELLPANSIAEIIKQWQSINNFGDNKPLYDIFKVYFNVLNLGRDKTEKKQGIFAFNGGLFQPDSILDTITISDAILEKHAQKLTQYDFKSEVSVNILGHIFENSLSEIEEIKNELQGIATDKSQSKRKKDGVFYTPKYITKYIVDNTLGKLCDEKKLELGIKEDDYKPEHGKKRQQKTINRLQGVLEQYRNWLLEVSICDPACGSGAFLNQALEFLIAEHQFIESLQSKLFGGSKRLFDIETHILENNLYGVDINEESVEIAKLSLWLRTAKKGRKLTSLNDKIKCGNSLIDDKQVAGNKAFNWQKEFSNIFEQKNNQAFHLTWVTHNSRVSARMMEYKVKTADSFILDDQAEVNVAQSIKQVVESEKLKVMAYNSCKDHIHLLLVCEPSEIAEIVRKLKGKSSQKLKEYLGVSREETFNLWAQKYSATEINTEEQLDNTVQYIKNNREKHNLPINKGLQPLVACESLNQSYQSVFKPEYQGGFDVVIGNPPYVQLQKLGKMSEQLKKCNYKSYQSTGDLYCLFYEKGQQILKENGLLGFITSNKWMRAGYGKSIRQFFVAQTDVYNLIDLGSNIFADATVDSNILCFKNQPIQKQKIKALDLSNEEELIDFSAYQNQATEISPVGNESWNISSKIEQNLKQKIERIGTPLKDWDIEIFRGVLTGYNEAFIIDKATKDNLIAQDPKSEEILKPILRGRDIKRYTAEFAGLYLIATFPALKIDIDKYTAVKNYLESFGKKLEQTGKNYIDENGVRQKSRKKTQNKWFETQDTTAYFEEFEKEKILYQEMVQESSFSYHNFGDLFCLDTGRIITGSDLLFLLTFLNTKLFFFCIKNFYGGGALGNNAIRMKHTFFIDFPIPKISNQFQTPFIEKADLMLEGNKALQRLVKQFIGSLLRRFESLEKLSQRLEKWYLLNYDELIKELAKKKIKLSLKDEAEWQEYFETEKQKALTLKNSLDTIDQEIDQMVYQLYDLTDQEIAIIEQNT